MNIETTLDEREERYGKFATHANLSQSLKSQMRTHHNWWTLSTDKRESLEMIMHKVARILNGDPKHVDNWHDIAGYAVLVERELEEAALVSDRRNFNRPETSIGMAKED